MPGEHTYEEIMSQPEAWTAALELLRTHSDEIEDVNPHDYDEVIFTGCGSTYYLAVAAAALFQELDGVCARGLPASEIWLYPKGAYSAKRKTLLVAVSRSGTTTETVRAVESFRKKAAGKVVTLTCYPQSVLARLGDVNLVFESGQEKSIAQTRAFSVLYLATTYLGHVWAGASLESIDFLPNVCRRLLETHPALAERFGRNSRFDRFYFLGSGPRYGLACELSLKMKEMTLSHSEPFHFLEFRHGPQSMVSDTTLIIGLVSEVNGMYERSVLREMKERGAHVLSLADKNADVAFGSGVQEPLRNPLYLPVVQLLAFERSLFKGLEPDRPHNLEAVVMLE